MLHRKIESCAPLYLRIDCTLDLQLEAAAAEVLLTLKTKPVGEEGEADQPERREVQVLITSQENPISPRQLTVSRLALISPENRERVISCSAVHGTNNIQRKDVSLAR